MEHRLSLPQGPGDLLVQGEVHPVRLTATSETSNLCHHCLPEWWQYYLANLYSLVRFSTRGYGRHLISNSLPTEPVQGTASIVSETTNPDIAWSQRVDVPTAKSPIPSQSQNPEKPPPTLAHGSFDWSFGDQAAAMLDCHTHAEYSQVGQLMMR
jgi:hypothetical protein